MACLCVGLGWQLRFDSGRCPYPSSAMPPPQMAVSFVAAMFLVMIPAANDALDHRAVWAVSGWDDLAGARQLVEPCGFGGVAGAEGYPCTCHCALSAWLLHLTAALPPLPHCWQTGLHHCGCA